MVNVCMVHNCKNSKKSTKAKDCKLFSVPNDSLRCKEWLTNCGRTDLFGKPVYSLNKNCRVCSDHFNVKMYSNPERTRLLPSAIPTEFGSSLKSSVDKVPQHIIGTETIADQFVSDEVVVTCTPSKPDHSVSSSCKVLSPCSFELSTSTSSQTTHILSVNTPREKKLRTEIRDLKEKCEYLEQKVESLSEELVKKTSTDNLTSVEHFYELCDTHLPPDLAIVVKNYVQTVKRKQKKNF